MRIKTSYSNEVIEPMSYGLVRVKTWDEARSLAQRMTVWTFRGQSDAAWPLESSIERAARLHRCPSVRLWEREHWMVTEFMRRAHHYIPSPPATEDAIQWLSLIQHYGGATRLLDFTHSFYVAAFFAVERAQQDAAVWAVNLSLLEDTVGQHLHFSPGDGPTLFLHWANQMVGSAPGRGIQALLYSCRRILCFPLNRFGYLNESPVSRGFFSSRPTWKSLSKRIWRELLSLLSQVLRKLIRRTAQ